MIKFVFQNHSIPGRKDKIAAKSLSKAVEMMERKLRRKITASDYGFGFVWWDYDPAYSEPKKEMRKV